MPGENIYDWSTTAANNGNADTLINWAEGQPRASVNNSARSMMAAIAKARDLRSGLFNTSGSANAQTIVSGVGYTTLPTALRMLVKIGAGLTNTGSTTLDVDGIGPVTIKTQYGHNFSCGELAAGTYVDLLYNGTNLILLEQTGRALLGKQTVTAPAGAVLFTTGLDSTYDEYQFRLTNIVTDTDVVDLWIRVSTDGGSNWHLGASDYHWACFVVADNGTTSITGSQADAQIKATVGGNLSNLAARALNGTVMLSSPANGTTMKQFRIDLTSITTSGIGIRWVGTGLFPYATPINGVRFQTNSGNFAGGSAALYGVR